MDRMIIMTGQFSFHYHYYTIVSARLINTNILYEEKSSLYIVVFKHLNYGIMVW
jgi:hypothetical protein